LTTSAHSDPVSADPPLAARLHAEGRWLVDDAGRVVLLHGVNNVDKYAPFVTLNDGFTLNAQDAALLARHGFNTVRLGVEFAGMMPQRGVIDTAYLDRVKTVVDLLGTEGIRVLIDHHQDSMSSVFLGGNGFPAWAVTHKPLPNEPDVGWPLNSATMASLNLSWTSFWNNKQGVVDLLGDAFTALATTLRGDPAILGYEVINEPWPGTVWPTCVPAGCPLFDRRFQAVHQRLTDRLHQGDPGALVFWEPNVLWNELVRTHIDEPPVTPKVTSNDIVFSFHDYCSFSEGAIYLGLPPALKATCDVQHDAMYLNYDGFAKRSKLPAMVTEFGGTSDAEVVARTMPRADKRFLGWHFWHYQSSFPPSAPARPDPFTGDLGRQLVRTYPRATAGIPGAMTYDATNGAFAYSYATRPSTVPTEIYVSDVQYPDGYRVALTGACALSAPGDRLLLLKATPGALGVSVTVTAGTGAWPGC
jgi:endoglycosylceramidase